MADKITLYVLLLRPLSVPYGTSFNNKALPVAASFDRNRLMQWYYKQLGDKPYLGYSGEVKYFIPGSVLEGYHPENVYLVDRCKKHDIPGIHEIEMEEHERDIFYRAYLDIMV